MGEGVPRKRGEIEKKEPWQRDLIRQLKGRIVLVDFFFVCVVVSRLLT